jgi:hypothetical protein
LIYASSERNLVQSIYYVLDRAEIYVKVPYEHKQRVKDFVALLEDGGSNQHTTQTTPTNAMQPICSRVAWRFAFSIQQNSLRQCELLSPFGWAASNSALWI